MKVAHPHFDERPILIGDLIEVAGTEDHFTEWEVVKSIDSTADYTVFGVVNQYWAVYLTQGQAIDNEAYDNRFWVVAHKTGQQ